jgi:hypothetical protein
MRFSIQLLVRSYPGHPVSTFSIQPVPELDAAGIDLENDDFLINPVTKDTQLMQGAIPWRGAREKDPLFFQMFIEFNTAVGDIVLDCTASTSNKFNCIFLSPIFWTPCFDIIAYIFYFTCRSVYSCLSQGRPPYCGHGVG